MWAASVTVQFSVFLCKKHITARDRPGTLLPADPVTAPPHENPNLNSLTVLPREHPEVFQSRAECDWSAPTKALMRQLWVFLCCHSFGFCQFCWLMLLQQSRDRLWRQMGKCHSWQTKKGKNSISELLSALVCLSAPENTEPFYHEPLRAALKVQPSKRNIFICSAEKFLYFTAMSLADQLISDLTIFWEIKLNVCQEKKGSKTKFSHERFYHLLISCIMSLLIIDRGTVKQMRHNIFLWPVILQELMRDRAVQSISRGT